MKEFTVDVAKRTVTHESGASASFYEYPTEEEWLASDVVGTSNAYLFPGAEIEFARLAKMAALEAGMKAQRS